MSPAWPTDPGNADHFTGAGYGAAAVARYPRHHRADGRRADCRSASCLWAPWSEPRLVELAYAEAGRARRKAPRLLPTIEIAPASALRLQPAICPRLRTMSMAISSACS